MILISTINHSFISPINGADLAPSGTKYKPFEGFYLLIS